MVIFLEKMPKFLGIGYITKLQKIWENTKNELLKMHNIINHKRA